MTLLRDCIRGSWSFAASSLNLLLAPKTSALVTLVVLRSSASPPLPLPAILILAQIRTVAHLGASRIHTYGTIISLNVIINLCKRPWQCARWRRPQCVRLTRRGPLTHVMPAMPMTM